MSTSCARSDDGEIDVQLQWIKRHIDGAIRVQAAMSSAFVATS